jgi:hypothetical protein
MSLTLTHLDRSFDHATRTTRTKGSGADVTATASRCDRIIALIDACLADLGPVPETRRPLAGSAAQSSR